MDEQLTQEQEQELREQLASEIWGDGEGKPEPIVEEREAAAAEEAPQADPWADVPEVLKQTIQDIRGKLGAVDSIGSEIKTWSGRIGALQREFQLQKNAAEQAAKQVMEAPSKEKMAEAAQDDEAWKELKEEFPEWANALDKRTGKLREELRGEFSQQIANLRQQAPQVDIDGLRRELKQEYEVKLLSVKHPTWREMVNSAEYTEWLNKQDAETKRKALESQDAIECIQVLDAFTGAAPKKNVAQVAAKRQERLASSVTAPGGGRPVKSKSIDDMSPEEYREYVAKQIWSD